MAETISHDAAIELLPWLVNDSLAGDERASVEAHASSCVICRRELAELEVLRRSIHTSAEHVAVPEPDMRRINARIDAQLERESRGRNLLAGIRQFLASPWRVAFVVQTAALVAVAVLWLQPREADAPFTTLTAPEVLPAGHYLRVVFDPDADQAALRELLDDTGLSVAAGPSERGVMTLRFADGIAAADRTAISERLLADARVLFVQPVTGGP